MKKIMRGQNRLTDDLKSARTRALCVCVRGVCVCEVCACEGCVCVRGVCAKREEEGYISKNPINTRVYIIDKRVISLQPGKWLGIRLSCIGE